MTPLIPQTLNRNGTGADVLTRQYIEIDHAFENLMIAIRMATPHGRDYQTAIEPNAASHARNAWSERYGALDAIRKEFAEAGAAVNEQTWHGPHIIDAK